MNYYLIQMVLGAGGEDVDQWTNILVVVVMGVFWLVGSLLKARSNQKKQEQAESGRGANPKPYQKMQRPIGRAVQRQRGGSIRPEPIALEAAVKRREVPHRAGRAAAGPEIQMEGVVEPIEELEELKIGPMGLTPKKGKQPSGAVEEMPGKPLFDFDDADGLKRAILHYEILGKPLSLRRPFD